MDSRILTHSKEVTYYEEHIDGDHGSGGEFSALSFAGEAMKGGHVLVFGEEQNEKKDDKKGDHADTFTEKKKKDQNNKEDPK